MHMSNRGFGIVFVVVKYVCCTTVGSKSSVHRQIEVFNPSKLPENLVEMLLINVLR